MLSNRTSTYSQRLKICIFLYQFTVRYIMTGGFSTYVTHNSDAYQRVVLEREKERDTRESSQLDEI